MPPPVAQRTGFRGCLQPPELGILALAGQDQVDAADAVDLGRLGEHPLHQILGRRDGLLSPGRIAECLTLLPRCPVDEDRTGPALATRNDIHHAVGIEIHPDGVLHRWRAAHGDGRPGVRDLLRPRVDVGPRDAAFLPAGHDVEKAITVDVGQLDAIGAARRIVNGVTKPGAFSP